MTPRDTPSGYGSDLGPATRLLGVIVPGPFALLNLSVGECSEADVVRALEHRLGQLAAHPHGFTPQADEVRLALHAAAAQLLDPAVRQLVIASAPQGAAEAPELHAPADVRSDAESTRASGIGPHAGTGAQSLPPNSLDWATAVAIEADTMKAVAMSGGWNRNTLTRLAMLAHARGISSAELVQGVERMTRRKPSMAAPGPQPGAAFTSRPGRFFDEGVPRDEAVDPGARALRALLIFSGLGLAMLVGVLALLALVIVPRLSPSPTNASLPPSQFADAEVVSSEPARVRPEPERATVARPEPDAVLRQFQALNARAGSDVAGMIKEFGELLLTMGNEWPSWDEDVRRALLGAQLEFVVGAAARGQGAGAVEAITRLAQPWLDASSPRAVDIAPMVWSAGVLNRVVQEPDIRPELLQAARLGVNAMLGGTRAPAETGFAAGAVAALGVIRDRLAAGTGSSLGSEGSTLRRAAEAELWLAWIRTLRTGAPIRAETEIVAALDLVLHSSIDHAHETSQATLNALVSAARWRENDPAQAALLEWLADDSVPPVAMAAVTRALAGTSAAPGVTMTMVLSTGASARDRAALRDEYSAAWNLRTSEERAQAMAAWAAASADSDGAKLHRIAASGVMGDESGGSAADQASTLAETVRLARLNSAASLLFAGRFAQAEGATSGATAGLNELVTAAARPGTAGLSAQPAVEGLSSWGVSYLSAGANVEQRLVLLKQVVAAPPPADAEVICIEAVRGSPVQVRSAARDIVLRFAATPAVSRAMLETAPIIPATAENSTLLQQMTGVALPNSNDKPAWPLAVRRALVERAVATASSGGGGENVDVLSDLYRDILAERAEGRGAVPRPPGAVSAGGAAAPDALALALGVRLAKEATELVPTGREHARLSELLRAHEARLALARGSVQRTFAALWWSLDLLAYVVVAEQPTLATQAARVLDEFAHERVRARHILAQLAAAERAQLKLWRLRILNSDATDAEPPVDASPAAMTPDRTPSTEETRLEIAKTPEVLVAQFGERLAQLDRTHPEGYMLLAEEVADDARRGDAEAPHAYALAVRLYVLAIDLARRPIAARDAESQRGIAAAACFALADLSRIESERRWLRAITATLDGRYAALSGVVAPPLQDASARLRAAEVLGKLRAGDGMTHDGITGARDLLRDAAVRQVFADLRAALELPPNLGDLETLDRRADAYPFCPECKNARIVKRIKVGGAAEVRACGTCLGNPGPPVSRADYLMQLRVESWLLGNVGGPWAAQLAMDLGAPLRAPDADEIASSFLIDSRACIWRGGVWTTP